MIHESVNLEYQNSIYKDHTFVSDGLVIPYDRSWKKIAFSISGGADSAMLAYIICDHIYKNNLEVEINLISHVRMWKSRPWQRYNSIDVFRWFENRFPNLRFTRHENFIPPDLEYGNKGATIIDEYGNLRSGDQIIVRSHAEWFCHANDIDAWYSALSRNPSDKTITKSMESRNTENPEISKLILKHKGTHACHPFLYTEKDWIIKQYLLHDILDLLNITRSCEGDFDDIDFENYVPGQPVPVCGSCFWCQERQWAMRKNDVRI